jgi:hypothetical protein
MDEAALCDRIALIQGTILKIDTPTNIISKYDKTIYDVHYTEYPSIDSGFKEYPSSQVCMPLKSHIHYSDKKIDFSPIELEIT